MAETRIDLDDPRYPPELYQHVYDMITQLSSGYRELKNSDMFPIPISLCSTLGENSPVYCPLCPPPKIEIAFRALKDRVYDNKRRSPPPLYKTEGAWIQHHWRKVHGNVVIPVPAPNSKVSQSSRGAPREVYRCPLHGTQGAKQGCESWAYKSVNGYCDNHFHSVHCAIETRYMTDWPWQHGDLPWMTGQLPLAGEELPDYIYRVVHPSWATMYADLVLGHLPRPYHSLEELVDEWRKTDPDFVRTFSLFEEENSLSGSCFTSPMFRVVSRFCSPEPSPQDIIDVDSPEYIIID